MKKLWRFSLLVMVFIMIPELSSAQSPVTIVYSGLLADMNEEVIANKKGIIDFSIVNSEENKICEFASTFTTDETGSFLVSFSDPGKVFSNGSSKEMVDILITLKPNEGENWLPDGKFSIKYHLVKNSEGEYQMSRYEGQVLNYSYRLPVWQFSDIYPLSYLHSTFMISFSEEISNAQEIVDICNEMGGGEKMKKSETAPNRGVKGGYAVGGYKSKKK